MLILFRFSAKTLCFSRKVRKIVKHLRIPELFTISEEAVRQFKLLRGIPTDVLAPAATHVRFHLCPNRDTHGSVAFFQPNERQKRKIRASVITRNNMGPKDDI